METVSGVANVYEVQANGIRRAWLDTAKYQEMYKRSVEDPNGFWGDEGRRLDWMRPYTKVKHTSFDPHNVSIKWYEDGTLNVAANCIDRHLPTRGDQVAIIWEGDDPAHDEQITYRQLHERVCQFANVLKANGVNKGDRVTIYLPMIPEAAYAMLACARIGAIHAVVFGGFSPESLASRIKDADSKFIITADEGARGGKAVPLKKNTDSALQKTASGDEKVLVVRRSGNPIPWTPGRDLWLHEEVAKVDANCPPVEMNAEDPLFILYTSGSTGTPKGVVHSSGGYLVYASMTHQYAFDYRDGDIYWCTADVGWVTGHSYILYGPLANGATTLMFEGVPTYPSPSRFWDIVDKWRVNILYTAPTAIRSLMSAGDDFVKRTKRTSLRLLGSVGEPINPEAWEWYRRVVGEGRCPIVDTWWQTETGGIMIVPLPGDHQIETRIGYVAVLWGPAGACRRKGKRPRRTERGWSRDRRQLARTGAHGFPRSRALRADLLLHLSRYLLLRVTAADATRTATIGSPVASTTSSMFQVIVWERAR